ncbi:hypothetical protein ANN_21716 [Periplaneta americana]|uniref:Reverse transcriptase domain-containing protein n=1 Tax=Periplaneta americana TaxID=6978 RepID=A0ABQ8S798_PERAM|nr:hypothetical protein ANN_21716 [Periplaneta americana]
MAGLCEGGNEPSGSLKAICKRLLFDICEVSSLPPCVFAEMNFNRGPPDNKGDNISYFGERLKNMGGVIVGGRRIKCIRFADDMALLAEEETILRDMLLELNYNCEQYEMKMNASKRKIMVVARRIKKKEKKELVGSLAEKKLPTEESTGRNGEREKSSGQKILNDRQH